MVSSVLNLFFQTVSVAPATPGIAILVEVSGTCMKTLSVRVSLVKKSPAMSVIASNADG